MLVRAAHADDAVGHRPEESWVPLLLKEQHHPRLGRGQPVHVQVAVLEPRLLRLVGHPPFGGHRGGGGSNAASERHHDLHAGDGGTDATAARVPVEQLESVLTAHVAGGRGMETKQFSDASFEEGRRLQHKPSLHLMMIVPKVFLHSEEKAVF